MGDNKDTRRNTYTKMNEIRLAQPGEIARQKEIWKLCFGDSDRYIDFFYTHRYQEDKTALLLQDGQIVSMLTMLPIEIVSANKRSFNAAMLYAIATHPQYQHQGLASQLMDFVNKYLNEQNSAFSVLVPAEQQLFNFYRQQGYGDGFYLREVFLTGKGIESWPVNEACSCTIASIAPNEFNQRRDKYLAGRLYVSYADEEVAYQQKLSQLSGADIYGLDLEGTLGCAAVERMNSEKVVIKELLVPDELLPVAIHRIARLLPAQEYIVRTPAFFGQILGGSIRSFGMIRATQEIDWAITPEDLGYLGLAFD